MNWCHWSAVTTQLKISQIRRGATINHNLIHHLSTTINNKQKQVILLDNKHNGNNIRVYLTIILVFSLSWLLIMTLVENFDNLRMSLGGGETGWSLKWSTWQMSSLSGESGRATLLFDLISQVSLCLRVMLTLPANKVWVLK